MFIRSFYLSDQITVTVIRGSLLFFKQILSPNLIL